MPGGNSGRLVGFGPNWDTLIVAQQGKETFVLDRKRCQFGLLCIASALFIPDDLGGHRFKHQFFSLRVLDII